MSKNKNKNKQEEVKVTTVEKQEDTIKILNEANDDQVIEIDTSALDRELKSSEGGALVMPIRGGYSDKSSNKDKKDKKNNKKEQNTSGVSMFLKGEADAKEVDFKSEDEIKNALESEDLITLGKFIRKHPEVLAAYLNDKCDDEEEDEDKITDVEIDYEDVPEYEDDNSADELPVIELSKKQRKELKEDISEVLESINDKFSVKDLFKTVKKELDFDVVKFINKLLDRLDTYDVHEFNKFVRKTVKKIKGTEIEDFIKYLTGKGIVENITFLLDNKDTGYEDIEKTINEHFEQILQDPRMVEFIKIDFEDEEIEMLEGFDKVFIEVIRDNIKGTKTVQEDSSSVKEKDSSTSKESDSVPFKFNKGQEAETVPPRRSSNFLLNRARAVMASR